MVRDPDVIDGPGGTGGTSGFISAGERRQFLGGCLDDAGDGNGTSREGDGDELGSEAMDREHYGFLL
jgi:hypothetical protein